MSGRVSLKETRYIAFFTQVIVRTARQKELLTAALTKFFSYERTEKSVPPGHHDALVFPECHLQITLRPGQPARESLC